MSSEVKDKMESQDGKLFTVSLETEVVVYAKDRAAAERIARENLRELDSEQFDVRAHASYPGQKFPWDNDQIPFNENPDDFRTIGEILAGKPKEDL